MRTAKLLLVVALLALWGLGQSFAMTIEAEVDRTEVGFGESLTLVVTLSQDLSGGSRHSLGLPRIDSIPGFDIASTRSSQSTSFINGVGTARTQIYYELVPQQPGKFTIPAFSFSDGSGKNYSTKAIEITVMPPPAEEERSEENSSNTPVPVQQEGSGFFKALLVMGLLLAAIIAPVLILSGVTRRRGQPGSAGNGSMQGRESIIEDAEVVTSSDAAARPAPVSETVSSAEPRRVVDFTAEVDQLKRQHPEVDKDFYQKYFEIFGRAALAGSSSLSESMTSDEMLKKAGELCSSEASRQACRRLSNDIELTLYANRPPARAFSAIDADARDIINAIMQ